MSALDDALHLELVERGEIVMSARDADGDTCTVWNLEGRRYLVTRIYGGGDDRSLVILEELVALADGRVEGGTLARQLHAHLTELGVPGPRNNGVDLDLEERITWLARDRELQLSTLGERNEEIATLRSELARARDDAGWARYYRERVDEAVARIAELERVNAHLRRTST